MAYLGKFRDRVQRWIYRHLLAKPKHKFLFLFIPKDDLNFFKFKTGIRIFHSQLGQDLLPEYCFGPKIPNGGYFVEVGANDGITYSNTLLLEKYGWKGILVEPDPRAFTLLVKNRSAICLPFAITNYDDVVMNLYFSSDTLYSRALNEPSSIENERRTLVQGLTLNRALENNFAPKTIHLITIDVEGGELEVLEGLDLDKYKFHIICVEYNYDFEKLEKIEAVLNPYGYERILRIASQFDAWFINSQSFRGDERI